MDRDLQESRGKMDSDPQEIRVKIDHNYQKHQRRLNGLRLAMQGETFANQCAIARFDQRVSALEKRSRPRKPK